MVSGKGGHQILLHNISTKYLHFSKYQAFFYIRKTVVEVPYAAVFQVQFSDSPPVKFVDEEFMIQHCTGAILVFNKTSASWRYVLALELRPATESQNIFHRVTPILGYIVSNDTSLKVLSTNGTKENLKN